MMLNPLALDDARQRVDERLRQAAADALADGLVANTVRVSLANGLRSLALRLDPALNRSAVAQSMPRR